MSAPLVTGHAWRPKKPTSDREHAVPWRDRPCAFAGCGRPYGEHGKAVSHREPQ